ncbi:MAG: DUF4398 domain-containing protein [Steroidobacteraceae bacterium]
MSASTDRVEMPVLAVATLALLGGCGGVSELTRQQVTSSATSIQQAEQTIADSESGALELQRAKEHLSQAYQAMNDNDMQRAERFAHLARLGAELAVAKAQNESARNAANELRASIETLRKEAERNAISPEQPR